MLEILEEIKDYIKTNEYLKSLNTEIKDSYLPNGDLKGCKVVLLISNEYDENTSADFEKHNIVTIPFQINCYGVKKKVNDNLKSERIIAISIADEISKMFTMKNASENISRLIRIRKSGSTYPQPIKEGSSYVVVLRYEMQIAK